MSSLLKGTIVENSLRDTRVLGDVHIVRTWKTGDWTLHDILIQETEAKKFGKHLAEGPWYIHFWEPGEDDVLVVFRDKIFSIKHSDRSTWEESINHGLSLGIPESQLDFPID